MAEPCIHDLDPMACAVCNGAEKRAAAAGPERGPWIIAQFGGFCSGCQLGIDPGDPVRSGGTQGWLCGDCGSEAPDAA